MVVVMFPEIATKVFTLKEFVSDRNQPYDVVLSSDRSNIAEPYGSDLSSYRQCAEEIDRALNLLQEKLEDVES
jgi:protein-tyrosine-phosphatase